MSIVVLMSTYNGEKFLKDQLNSLVTQTLKPDKILIRDDGSSDSTIEILKYYSDLYPFIEYYVGKNLGPAKSFMELINKVNGFDYYSLCDQDDVWFKDKLEIAVNTLKDLKKKSTPLLYASRFTLTDENLNPLNSEISHLYRYKDFPHALLYQSAPGCTMVFNDAARKKIKKYDMNKEYVVIHDSIIHKIVTMFGEMVLDFEPRMFYRQHGNNEIGLTADKKRTTIDRIKRFFTGKLKNYRRDTAKSLLNVYGESISEENKHLLEIVAKYDVDKTMRKELLRDKRFKTGTINDLFFKILVIFRYI